MFTRIPILTVTLFVSFVSLLAGVLVIVGLPMAGAMSAVVVPIVGAMLTIPMAFAFSHGPNAAEAVAAPHR